MLSTRVVNRESVALGLAQLYLGPSASNIANINRALTESSDYFGAKTLVSFKIDREFHKRLEADGNILMLMDHLLTRVDLSIDLTFIEIKSKTLSYALGGDGSSADFLGDVVVDPVDLRAELIFTYPNKVNRMEIILPRIQIATPGFELPFSSEDAMQSPMTIKACLTTQTEWAAISRPLGRVIFV